MERPRTKVARLLDALTNCWLSKKHNPLAGKASILSSFTHSPALRVSTCQNLNSSPMCSVCLNPRLCFAAAVAAAVRRAAFCLFFTLPRFHQPPSGHLGLNFLFSKENCKVSLCLSHSNFPHIKTVSPVWVWSWHIITPFRYNALFLQSFLLASVCVWQTKISSFRIQLGNPVIPLGSFSYLNVLDSRWILKSESSN